MGRADQSGRFFTTTVKNDLTVNMVLLQQRGRTREAPVVAGRAHVCHALVKPYCRWADRPRPPECSLASAPALATAAVSGIDTRYEGPACPVRGAGSRRRAVSTGDARRSRASARRSAMVSAPCTTLLDLSKTRRLRSLVQRRSLTTRISTASTTGTWAALPCPHLLPLCDRRGDDA